MEVELSHYYDDPETGDRVEVMMPVRNARASVRSSRRRDRVGRRGRDRVGRRDRVRRRRRDEVVRVGGSDDRVGGPSVRPYDHDQDRLSVNKDALIGLIPAAGMVWASFLGLPEEPRATGDHVTDRDNAAAHRTALARHDQNQTRILALTNLAERSLRLLMGRD